MHRDLRARLELAVVNILALAAEQESQDGYEYSSDNENYITDGNAKIITAVRKQLAISIRDLMQHGLTSVMAKRIKNSFIDNVFSIIIIIIIINISRSMKVVVWCHSWVVSQVKVKNFLQCTRGNSY